MAAKKALDRFVGQDRTVKLLKMEAQKVLLQRTKSPHILLHGCPGVGKTELLEAYAKDAGLVLKSFLCNRELTPKRLTQELLDLDASGYDSLGRRTSHGKMYAIFLDEIDNLQDPACLFRVMTHNEVVLDDASVEWIPHCGILMATNNFDKLPDALMSRLDLTLTLQPYQPEHIQKIIEQSFPDMKAEDVAEVVKRSRNNPRRALKYARGVYGTGIEWFELVGISDTGLESQELAYLDILKHSARPLSLATISNMLGESSRTVAMYERELLSRGLITILSSGRTIVDTQESHRRGPKHWE